MLKFALGLVSMVQRIANLIRSGSKSKCANTHQLNVVNIGKYWFSFFTQGKAKSR